MRSGLKYDELLFQIARFLQLLAYAATSFTFNWMFLTCSIREKVKNIRSMSFVISWKIIFYVQKKVLDKLAPQISPKFSLNSYSYIFWHHFPKYFKNSQKFSKISTFSKKINWKSILFGCIGRRKLFKPRDWPRRNL